MSDLKPCPFCGSGWLYETRRNGYCDETPTMFCNSCKAVVTWEQVEEEGVNDKTKAFVREHWNSRAERTCECIVEYAKSPLDGKTIVLHRCSSCNELMRPHMNYCPNCGAKVVGE